MCPDSGGKCKLTQGSDPDIIKDRIRAGGNGSGEGVHTMKRVLLKLSGEALAGDKKTGFDEATCLEVAGQVKKLVDQGIQIAIVTGGGNFWRGRTSETIDRVKADQIGMLATVMNCIYVSEIFRYAGWIPKCSHHLPAVHFTTLFFQGRSSEALEDGQGYFLCGRNRTSVFLHRYRSCTQSD